MNRPLFPPARRFLPVKALYLLEKNETDERISINEIKGFKKFELLKPLGIRYTLKYLTLSHNQMMGEFLNSLPLFGLSRPFKMESMDEVYISIVNHTKNKSQGEIP